MSSHCHTNRQFVRQNILSKAYKYYAINSSVTFKNKSRSCMGEHNVQVFWELNISVRNIASLLIFIPYMHLVNLQGVHIRQVATTTNNDDNTDTPILKTRTAVHVSQKSEPVLNI